MDARKFYEEKISKLIKNTPEKELAGIVSMLEKIKEEKTKKYLQVIEQEQGRFNYVLSSTEQFAVIKEG